MRYLNKILAMTMALFFITTNLISCGQNILNSSLLTNNERAPIKVGVFLYRMDDYITEVCNNLQEIQKENQGKVEFVFFDSKLDQNLQNENINKLLNEGVDLLLVNLVDIGSAETVINMIKGRNVPVILFNREPLTTDAIKSYRNSIYIGTDAKEAGIMQGEILINLWNKNKEAIDRNKNNIIEYVVLKGEKNNIEAIERTKYSILTINNAGIETNEIASCNCNWDENLAEYTMEEAILSKGNKIEIVIANDDAMAIGAIKALQQYGFNKEGSVRTIPVVGINAVPRAEELIKNGFMAGTVLQDANAMAKALYVCGMNLVARKSAIDGTEYKFDDTGVSIRIPYREYTAIK
jgi:methyl-galactoside transport system substrate-binding protein